MDKRDAADVSVRRGMLRIPRRKKALPSSSRRSSIASICTLASCFSLAAGSSHLSPPVVPPTATFIASRHRFGHHQGRQGGSTTPALQPHASVYSSSNRKLRRHYLDPPSPLLRGARNLRQGSLGHNTLTTMMSQSTASSRSEKTTEPNEITSSSRDDDGSAVAAAGEYFDEGQFAAFECAVEDIVSKKNVVRDFRKNGEDLRVVKEHLLDRGRKLPRWDIRQFLPSKEDSDANNGNANGTGGGGDSSSAVGGYAKRRIRERCETYLDRTGLTTQQHKLATVLLAHLADHCAKNSSPRPLYVAWEKILEAGMTPLSRTLSTYLYVLSLEDGNTTESSSQGGGDIAADVAMFHDALYEPTEKTITLLVKSLVGRGDAAGAEALLEGLVDGPLGQLRHRTTSPILKLYCERGEMDSALRLYRRMRTTSRVKMDAATYADFIAAVAQQGYFRADSECIVGAEDLGYDRACGTELLDALIMEMAEDVLDITEESARVLHNGFTLGFKERGHDAISSSDGTTPTATLFDSGSLVANRVAIDKNTAKCPATNATLRLIVLEQSQRVHVHNTLVEMAREKSKEYTARLASKGRSTRDNAEKAELATKILREFSEWLDAREGEPYTAIVDGANIAYFGWGRLNIHQLIHMVNALEQQGERPLVVFPEKYTRRKFHLRHGMIQVLRDEELGLLEGLRDKGQMYVVPPMCLDDLYWMLASVSNQTASTAGQNIDVPKNNTEGRFPGLRPMVISNDKMRDHKMELLEERAFRRWCCSHIVNYNFTEFIENPSKKREIHFQAADLFSDEIQGNECPCDDDDDGGDGGGGGMMAWHFPVSEWDSNERFCLRLPS
mmetsp:Transcript_5096/g.12799  ORF Transcript_5096/g.12799 Transcript_5096/m.12799 type:complete len:841 (-) Transcript_5096:1421-3943(-)